MSSPSGVAPKPAVRSVNCPQCGATLTLRSFGRAVSLVCGSCRSILDALDPRLKILQTFKAATNEEKPKIPLGARGKWDGIDYEVIGFQRRSINAEGIEYSWHEYLLFNPYRGFRYFTEYNGHWNDVLPLTMLPDVEVGLNASCFNRAYKHFQSAGAKTKFVLGEFPWQVRVGEKAEVADYIAPPYVLSSESMQGEVTWSQGEYVSGKEIWKAFKLVGDPPDPIGIYANQPSPLRATSGVIRKTLGIFAATLFALFLVNASVSDNASVFEENYVFHPADLQEQSFVTPVFHLGGRVSDVELRTHAGLNNEWIYLNYALINDDTGQAYDVGRELSFYSGYDDGYWSEGNQNDFVDIASVPPGNYYLRVEPESDRSFSAISYNVKVVRDVPIFRIYLYALGALLVPALVILWRTFSFEQQRWAESDHPMGTLMEETGLDSFVSDDDE